ncbi:MAG: RNA polymerase sigma factor [Roseburia sp.]|nr:RNA polymerase sigma factor [Roseburia sp.]MCM1241532.1 RNA polymerase sigma factor [Roseburia sp.]
MQQDYLLVRRMQNGDEEAMELFVREYYPFILKYCYYHCPDRESAQDLTQETFTRFFTKLSAYRHRGKALNYLYTIAGNLCIDFMRKNRNGYGVPFEMSPENETVGENETAGVEEKIIMEEALKKLPDELREVVILHYFQELSLKETAAVLQIGLPLAKYRIAKAREKLRGML